MQFTELCNFQTMRLILYETLQNKKHCLQLITHKCDYVQEPWAMHTSITVTAIPNYNTSHIGSYIWAVPKSITHSSVLQVLINT